jgi:hypothetical protein
MFMPGPRCELVPETGSRGVHVADPDRLAIDVGIGVGLREQLTACNDNRIDLETEADARRRRQRDPPLQLLDLEAARPSRARLPGLLLEQSQFHRSFSKGGGRDAPGCPCARAMVPGRTGPRP